MGYSDSDSWSNLISQLDSVIGDDKTKRKIYRLVLDQLEDMDFDVWDELVDMDPDNLNLRMVLEDMGHLCSHRHLVCADCGHEID